MPDERDIEKSLRAWAKRRREDAGAPLELHPAARRLLQDEAARLKGGQKGGSIARWLWGSPLRLVLNLSAVAALVVAVVLVLPQHRPSPAGVSTGSAVLAENNRDDIETPMAGAPLELAQADKDLRDASKFKSNGTAITLGDSMTVAKKETAPPSANPVPGAAPPSPTFDQEQIANNATAIQAAAPTVASAAAPTVTSPAATPAEVPGNSIATDADMPVPTPAPAPPVQSLAWVSSPTNPAVRDYLSAKLPEVMPLLGSFHTEQTGNRLRVIDADGSVYIGEIDSPAPQTANGTLPPVQSRAFRVSGTSVTRHQPVVFVGHLVMSGEFLDRGQATVAGGYTFAGGNGGYGGGGFTNAGAHRALAQTNVTGTNAVHITAGTTFNSLQFAPQSSVQGTLYVGTNEMQIRALPVGP